MKRYACPKCGHTSYLIRAAVEHMLNEHPAPKPTSEDAATVFKGFTDDARPSFDGFLGRCVSDCVNAKR